MRALVDSGYVYIAQPPLFRAKRGRSEFFIRDEREMEKWLIRRAAESRVLVLQNGEQIAGTDLEAKLEHLMHFRKLLQIVERRVPSRDVVRTLLDREARDKTFFADSAKVQALADALNTPTRTASVQPDEEHQAHSLVIEDRSGGYPRHHRVDLDFVTTSEFRALAASYQSVREIRGRMVVKTIASHGPDQQDGSGESGATANATAIGGAPLDEATKLAADVKTPDISSMPKMSAAKAKDADVIVETLDELVEFFVAAGKKGFDINRYKGLGEMNPDTLWETTMDPEKRTLLQVKAEDHMEADLMFTTLMGDQVEPRRKFIEDNALDVKNLDI
jgi:DNA gyrase subunit B